MVRPHLKNRQLFLSACSMTNDSLAKLLMPGSSCYSILGPDKEIFFNTAPILWASLYHVMFAWDSTAMTGPVLRRKAQAVADIYQMRLNYFDRDRHMSRGYISMNIIPREEAII
jgi:hypothetical protein